MYVCMDMATAASSFLGKLLWKLLTESLYVLYVCIVYLWSDAVK